MDNDIEQIHISSLVRQELDDFVESVPHAPLPVICEQVEFHLAEISRRSILKILNEFSRKSGVRYFSSPSELFIFDKTYYQLKISEHSTLPEVVVVTIKSVRKEGSKFIRKALMQKFNSGGRYTEVRVSTDEIFLPIQASISGTVVGVLEYGYRWLEEYVKIYLKSIRSETSIELYSHIRFILPEYYANRVWLYAIIEENGIYIPDLIAYQSALKLASERKYSFGQSPLELVADFSTRIVDFEKVFSKIAIAENRSILGNTVSAGYAGSGIEIAEQAVYQSGQFVIQPLVREGKTLLTAAYPSDVREHVEVILDREKEEFRRIVSARAASLRDTIETIQSKRILPRLKSKYFEYLGAFVRGLLDFPG